MIYYLSNRKVLQVTGDNLHQFFQGLITNDITKLQKPSDCIYSCTLNHKGRFLFDFFIVYENQNAFFIDIADIFADNFINFVEKYKLRNKIDVVKRDDLSILAGDIKEDIVISYQDQRSKNMPIRNITANHTHIKNNDEYNSLLIQNLIVDGRFITTEKGIILEYEFDKLNGISFNKGCYTGQELMMRTKTLGEIRKKLTLTHYSQDLENIITHDGKNALIFIRNEG